jgi:hypothetical protein
MVKVVAPAIIVGIVATVIVGIRFTVTEVVAVEVQPLTFVTVIL